MSKNEVDSTVLLLAMIAGTGALLLAGLPWLCGAAGVVLLALLFAYDLEGVRSVAQSFVFAGTSGYALAVAVVPITPYLFSASGGTDLQIRGKWLPIVWLASTILLFAIDRARMGGRVATGRGVPIQTVSAFASERPARAAKVPESRPVFPTTPPPTPPASPRPPEPEPVLIRDEPIARASEPPASPPTPIPSGKETSIFVNLTGEGLNLLRSVRAEHLGRDYYRIIDTMPTDETWEYLPGTVVRCRKKTLSSGKAMVAFEEAPRAQ